MSYKTISNTDRERIISLYLDGYTATEIEGLLTIHRKSAINVINVYLKTGRIEALPRGGNRECKLTLEIRTAIRTWIDEDCGISLRSIAEKVLLEFNVTVSSSTVNRAIGEFNYSVKRASLIPERRNCPATLALRKAYVQEFNSLVTNQNTEYNFYFIDEVGFNISMRTHHGRSLRGTRANHTVAAVRSRNISVCCIMSKDGISKYKVQTEAFNTVSYLAFVEQFLADLNRDQVSSAVLIMDNVPFHKKEEIKTAILAAGHMPLYLPTYSPFLNPIENMFSKWKQSIRSSKPTSEQHLLNLIDDCSLLINDRDCAGFFRHMLSYIPDCLNEIPITDG